MGVVVASHGWKEGWVGVGLKLGGWMYGVWEMGLRWLGR